MADTKSEPNKPANKKWTYGVGQHGYVMLPNILYRYLHHLEISPTQQAVLFHLLAFWWDAENHPEVSKATLAWRLGMSPRQVQRHLKELKAMKLIEVHASKRPGRHPNTYTFDGLVKQVVKFAQTHRRKKKRRDYEQDKEVGKVADG